MLYPSHMIGFRCLSLAWRGVIEVHLTLVLLLEVLSQFACLLRSWRGLACWAVVDMFMFLDNKLVFRRGSRVLYRPPVEGFSGSPQLFCLGRPSRVSPGRLRWCCVGRPLRVSPGRPRCCFSGRPMRVLRVAAVLIIQCVTHRTVECNRLAVGVG